MSREISIFEYDRISDRSRSELIKRTESDLSEFIRGVRPIIEAVKSEGDTALIRYAGELDKADITQYGVKVAAVEFDKAFDALAPDLIHTIEFAAASIKRFHQGQKPEPLRFVEQFPGVFAGDRFSPIPSVACYVPRGKGAFPSVVMMSTIPAVVAGVPKAFIVTPPGPDGRVDAATLVAARVSGIEAVYRCGGAQAVAAAAYGTDSVPRADKIVGPGSPWVVAAKRLLADVIDPGTPAGPSESIILADAAASARVAALDLIIESEHGPDSSAFLVTPSRRLAETAAETIPELWDRLGHTRADFSSRVLGGANGGIVITRDLDQAIEFVNAYAPEHLEVLCKDPFALMGRLTNAGEILLGEHTPITLGNFVLGPNAILPTSRAARIHSPLSVFDFMKMTSIGYVTAEAYPELADHAHRLAVYEGFDGHALAVSKLRGEFLASK
jgi:histidinol dehydrogenase